MFRRFSMVDTKPCEAWLSSPFYGRISPRRPSAFLILSWCVRGHFQQCQNATIGGIWSPTPSKPRFSWLAYICSFKPEMHRISIYIIMYIYIYKVIHKSTYWVCWELGFTPNGNVNDNGNNCNYCPLDFGGNCPLFRQTYIYIHIHV